MYTDIDSIMSDPDACILDFNKGEKLIIEMNNHICLGEYELARTFFQQILEYTPGYMKHFYNIIFQRGIPDKWLLTNQIRTTANYIWLLYKDYKNELVDYPNCPQIEFNKAFLKTNEFDLLIISAYFNSYENMDSSFYLDFDFLKELRSLYNRTYSGKHKADRYVPKLRILSPTKDSRGLYLVIEEKLYNYSVDRNIKEQDEFQVMEMRKFFYHLKNFVLSQPKLSNYIVDMILENCENREDTKITQKSIHVLYVNLIMVFINNQDYEIIYEYLKFIPYNPNIDSCSTLIYLLFSVIVLLFNNNLNREDVFNFCTDVINKKKKKDNKGFTKEDKQEIDNFKNHEYFSNKTPLFNRNENIKPSKDYAKWLLKHKVYESLLSNKNKELLEIMHSIEDYLIQNQTNNDKIPIFYKNYSHNLDNPNFYSELTYNQVMNLIMEYSKSKDEQSLESLWKKANNNIFWNEYLNFLRVEDQHCLGYALSKSIAYVQNNSFTDAVTFLHPLNNLKLLLIIFVWDEFENDISSRKKILDVFWNSYKKHKEIDSNYTLVPYFEDLIINLDYTISFSMWIQHRLKAHNEQSIDPNVIYNQILVNSIPSVLKNYLDQFEVNEMISYFKERFPKSNKNLQKVHFHSSMIIFSFYFYRMILKKIEDYFSNSTETFSHQLFSQQEKKEMIDLLNKIILVPYRLNIMGDMFNLIFIKLRVFINEKKISYNNQLIFHKKIFIELVTFLKHIMKSLDIFENTSESELNLNQIFNENYGGQDIVFMLEEVEEKEIFLEDLKEIDIDYLFALKEDPNISYKRFLIKKSNNLKKNLNELLFRFNIIDNPWLEVIYDNNANSCFLSTLLQNSKHYFQISKKFHMWDISKEIITFFKLPDKYITEIDYLKYFVDLKAKILCLNDNFELHQLIDMEEYKELAIKNWKINNEHLKIEIDEKLVNFEYFKLFFDLSLTENISTIKSNKLLELAKKYLGVPCDDTKVFHDVIEKYLILMNSSKEFYGGRESGDQCLSKLVVSTKKNVGISAPLTLGPSLFKNQLTRLSTQREALIALIKEVIENPNSINMSHNELSKYFIDANNTLLDYDEEDSKQPPVNEDISSMPEQAEKITNTPSYLKRFLTYLISIGNIYYQAKETHGCTKNTNYLKLLKKYPKEIIAKLFLKYNSEQDALKIAKATKSDFISVVLEYTKYYKNSVVNSADFGQFFNELVNYYENPSTNFIFNGEIQDKEDWLESSSKSYPVTMRILDFIYKFSSENLNNEHTKYIPLFVSLYRINFDELNDEDQKKYWELIIKNYKDSPIFKNYIKMIFLKFYFYKTFYKRNSQFKDLYLTLFEKKVPDNEKNKPNEQKRNTKDRYTTDEEKNDEEENKKIKEKIENYKKIYENVSNEETLKKMLPKSYSYIPTSQDYIQKLSGSLRGYLKDKIDNKQKNFSEFYKKNTEVKVKDIPSDLNIKFSNIPNISYQKNIEFYENLCRGLLNQQQYDLALEIADNYLLDIKTDVIQQLITEIVKNTNEEEILFKLLVRMKNKKLIFESVKTHLYDWKPETTLTILNIIKDEKGLDRNEISFWIRKLKVFYKIIKLNIPNYTTLRSIELNITEEKMNEFLGKLMDGNSHNLCYELLTVFGILDKYKNEVKFSEIKLLLSSNNIHDKIVALEKLSEIKNINFCQRLIDELNNYQNKELIIKYLLKNFTNQLKKKDIQTLQKKQVSIKVYFLLPKDIQINLKDWIDNTELILETLLINMKFDIIENIYYYFPQLQDDEIISFYAKKALSFNKINEVIECSKKAEIENEFIMIPKAGVKEFRETFYFRTAPDLNLFMRFMNLCTSIQEISKVCFEVSNNSSKILLNRNPTYPKILFINFISKILDFLDGKVKSYLEVNKKNNEIEDILEKMNTYKKLTRFFKQFIYHGIDNIVSLEIEKFFDIDYKIKVRDKLIENDYLNLAQTYCDELMIESSVVDLELGLYLLKNRYFNEARKRFEKILSPSNDSANETTNINETETAVEERETKHKEIVNKIIKILQGSFNLKIPELDKIHKYLSFRISCKSITNEGDTVKILERYRELTINKFKKRLHDHIKLENYNDVSLLDEYLKKEKKVIVQETLHYVKTYGTTKQLLNFYIDNGMLDEAVNHIIEKKIDLDTFTNEIVQKCFEKREKKMIEKLFHSLRYSSLFKDPSQAQKLIEQVITFLTKLNAHTDLIQLYELMNDHLKAGLEALKLTKLEMDVEKRKELFKCAGNNFEKLIHNMANKDNTYISNLQTDSHYPNIDKNSLIHLRKTILLQIEVLEIIPNIPYSLIKDNPEERLLIVQQIIQKNDDLAIKIINEYEIDVQSVFYKSTTHLISNRLFDDFERLLDIIAKWNKNKLFDKFKVNFFTLWNQNILQAFMECFYNKKSDDNYINDRLIPILTDTGYRITMLLEMKQYEKAYFFAIEENNKEVIVLIKKNLKDILEKDPKNERAEEYKSLLKTIEEYENHHFK